MKILGIHHVTMAVQDIEAARADIAALLDAAAGPIDAVAAFGVRSTAVALGDDTLELVAPMDADNPVMRYIERRGEGFYTLALEVDDLDAAVAELAARGVRVSPPVEASAGVRTSFVTMAATHGLSLQLLETRTAQSNNAPAAPNAAPGPEPTAEHAFSRPRAEPPPLIAGRSAANAGGAPYAEEQPGADDEDATRAAAEPVAARPVLDLTPDEWSDVD
ncbi:MAG TPA: VOC family protein [Vicinamibacterales bacterium]|nr:VOC family protein [Vicinamibacterales bacterium]